MRDLPTFPGWHFPEARPRVKEFYRPYHTHQTLDFVNSKHREILGLDRQKMSLWEALEHLHTRLAARDPVPYLTPLQHSLQPAEANPRGAPPP